MWHIAILEILLHGSIANWFIQTNLQRFVKLEFLGFFFFKSRSPRTTQKKCSRCSTNICWMNCYSTLDSRKFKMSNAKVWIFSIGLPKPLSRALRFCDDFTRQSCHFKFWKLKLSVVHMTCLSWNFHVTLICFPLLNQRGPKRLLCNSG